MKNAWDERYSRNKNPSFIHRNFSKILTRLGIQHKNEVDGFDVVIIQNEKRITLEIDGPSHYVSNGEYNGGTILTKLIKEELYNYKYDMHVSKSVLDIAKFINLSSQDEQFHLLQEWMDIN